jgi:hypothetical protein
MFITLTNANPLHKGRTISIRSILVATVYRNTVQREDDVLEEVTCLYCPPHGTWEVEESVEQVLDMLKQEPEYNVK